MTAKNDQLPTTRKDALACGAKFYFTGRACTGGHVERRYASSKVCVVCNRERVRAFQQRGGTRQQPTTTATATTTTETLGEKIARALNIKELP